MQCIGKLIGLNADHVPQLSARAYNLLAQLDDRYPDMLWSRLIDGVRASYAFQRGAFGSVVAVRLEGKEVRGG